MNPNERQQRPIAATAPRGEARAFVFLSGSLLLLLALLLLP